MTLTVVTEKVAERAKLWLQFKEVRDSGTEEKPLTAEDEATLRKLSQGMNDLDALIECEMREIEAHLKQVDYEQRLGTIPKNLVLGAPTEPATPAADAFRAAFADPNTPHKIDLGGHFRKFKEVGDVEYRALGSSPDSAGGALIPTTFVPELLSFLDESAAIRQTNVRVIQTASGESMEWPKVLTKSSAAKVSEQSDPLGQNDPTFGTFTLAAHKAGVLIYVPTELVEDEGSSIGLESFIAQDFGEALGDLVGGWYITGTGTGEATGITTVSTLGKTAAGPAAITADELLDLKYSVATPYRRRATWMMNDSTILLIRKLKDSNGQYLWAPGLTAGQPNTIDGDPYVSETNMPAATTGLKSVIYGDFSRYIIRDSRSVSVQRSDEFRFDVDQVAFRATMRTDGYLSDLTGAVKHLIQA